MLALRECSNGSPGWSSLGWERVWPGRGD